MVRETLDLYNKKTNIKKINKKMKKFPKLTERGRLHVMLRRCMQTETDNQTDHINITQCILFYNNRCSTLPPLCSLQQGVDVAIANSDGQSDGFFQFHQCCMGAPVHTRL